MPKGLTYIPVVPLEVAIFTYLMPQKGTLNLIAPKKNMVLGKFGIWDSKQMEYNNKIRSVEGP